VTHEFHSEWRAFILGCRDGLIFIVGFVLIFCLAGWLRSILG
jgi:hypothetical protein